MLVIKPFHSSIICVVLLGTFELTACSNEHKVLEANSQEDSASAEKVSNDDADKNGDSSVAADSEATVAVCEGETGVVVSGTIDFGGPVPETAHLWLYWQEPTPGIPPCSLEITPVHFPAEFRFEQVPDKGWTLFGFIDVDGGFPPIPVAGDFIVEMPQDELDLSDDVANINGQEAQERPVANADDLLRSQTVITGQRYQGIGNAYPHILIVRGIRGPDRLLVLLDGQPINNAINGFWALIQSDQSLGDSRLICERAACRRGNTPVLKNLSLEVRAHESVVLLGDNGVGKTTLLRLALGLERPIAGMVRTCGFDVSRTSTHRVAVEAALVLQNPDHQLFLETVLAEVASSKTGLHNALSEIEALGLSGLEARHPQSLSTGQKRRVTVAAALARRPKLLLIDEPTVGQDDASLVLLLKRLAHYVNEGGALMVATHDERAARALGSRIILLEKESFLSEGREKVDAFFVPSISHRERPVKKNPITLSLCT